MKTLLAGLLLLCSSTALAQPTALFNAEVSEIAGITDPAQATRKVGDGWFALEVPVLDGTHSPCCWESAWHISGKIGCSLESRSQSYGTRSDAPVEDRVIVYVKASGGKVSGLKVAGAQCPMDAGGRDVRWVRDADDGEALEWLVTLAQDGGGHQVGQAALWAIALHASETVAGHLHSMARAGNSELAEEAIFWLGEARGQAGYEALDDLLDELPPGDTRRHINFALSQNDSDEAVTRLQAIAWSDPDPEQRGEALFWLAQEHPENAEGLLREVIAQERDGEILEQAVFAVSQLPGNAGDRILMELAADPGSPREARRQALFWLVHEGDDETVATLTEALTR